MGTSSLQLTIAPEQAGWSLSHLADPGLEISGACLRLHLHQGGQRKTLLDVWQNCSVQGPEIGPTPLGPGQVLRVFVSPAPGLNLDLAFALPTSPVCLLWKVRLENLQTEPLTLEQVELLACHPATAIHFGQPKQIPDDLAFFSNGWQSWSYTGAYTSTDRFRHTRLSTLHRPMVLNAGTPVPNQAGHFSSELFGVLGSRSTRRGWLAGFLSQRQHFGSLEAHLDHAPVTLRLWANGDSTRLDPGASMETDWACFFPVQLDDPDPLGAYAQAVALTHGFSGSEDSPLSGWCSWYHYYQKIQVPDVLENIQAARALRHRLPLDLIQLDDGFEHAVGDWLAFSPNFLQGVAPLAGEIKNQGFTPGLWLAPFIVDPRSSLARAHPDWLLRGRLNRPVNAGYTFWGTFATALDLTHPAALDYAAQVTRTAAREWGYPFLKLDFLYAAALPGKRRDPTRTRAQILRRGLEALRQAAGEDCFLLGCGCPLGSAIGLVDGMRVSSDVSEEWEPSYAGIHTFFRHEPDFPSARNAIHNSLTRAFLHRRWWLNDPDVLLPGPGLTLNDAEFETLATVTALTGGLLLVSGKLAEITPQRIRQWSSLLPLIDQRPHLPDWMDSSTPRRLRLDLKNNLGAWQLLAYFNWSATPKKITITPGDFGLPVSAPAFAREFWTRELFSLSGDSLPEIILPPHGVRLFALHPYPAHTPAYLGSDLHISQGLEVNAWKITVTPENHQLEFSLVRPGLAQGSIDLYLPAAPAHATLNDLPLQVDQIAPQCYRFNLDFNRSASILIQYPATG